MSMHGTLSDMAVAAMTDERRDELRAAAEMVAAVFGMSRHQMTEMLVSGTVAPETEAEYWALTYGETACPNHADRVLEGGKKWCDACEASHQPAYFERHEIKGKEWYVQYQDGTGHQRLRFFGDVMPGVREASEFEQMIAFCKETGGTYFGMMNDPGPFGPWRDDKTGELSDDYNECFDSDGNLKPQHVPQAGPPPRRFPLELDDEIPFQ